MTERRRMTVGDWVNSAAMLAMGVLLGLVVHNLSKLVGTAYFWPMLILIPVLFGGVILLDRVVDGLFERIFPSGVKAAPKPQGKARRPLALLLSLPTGFTIGVIGAQFGLSALVLETIGGCARGVQMCGLRVPTRWGSADAGHSISPLQRAAKSPLRKCRFLAACARSKDNAATA